MIKGHDHGNMPEVTTLAMKTSAFWLIVLA